MVKKSDLKKLNSFMQEGNELKNGKQYNKAIEKYLEALRFVETRTKEIKERQEEIGNIKSQIDQVYSVNIVDMVDTARTTMQSNEFKGAYKILDEAIRIADKIEEIEMRKYEINQINFVKNEIRLEESKYKAKLLRKEEKYNSAIDLLKSTLTEAKNIYQDENHQNVNRIKGQMNDIYSIQVNALIKQANLLQEEQKYEEAIKIFQEALKITSQYYESELKQNDIEKLKNAINSVYTDIIKPLIQEGQVLYEKNLIEQSAQKFGEALDVASEMFDSDQRNAERKEINQVASDLLNPAYLERVKPILDKGKELIIKEYFEENITIVNESIELFLKALSIVDKMAESNEKLTKREEVVNLIKKTCESRINLLKDNSLKKIAQKDEQGAINELYAAISIAKRIPIPERENNYLDDLIDSVNKIYSNKIESILKEGTSQLNQKKYEKAIEIYNEALKITDKMYLTTEMENQVARIKSLTYQAELKDMIGRGDLTQEQKKFERELEKLNKKMEYAKTIDDPDRRYKEMEKIKFAIDEVHFSEIRVLVEQGNQLAANEEFEKAFEYYEQAMNVHELIESPEFKNRVPIKYHYKTELINKAKLEIKNLNFDVAIGDCEKALELDSTFVESYYYIGLTFIRKKEYMMAIENFDKAITLHEEYAEAWNSKGYALELMEQYQKAINSYAKAIEVNPSYAEAHYNMGNSYRHLNKLESAIQSYQKAVDIDNTLAEAWLFKGLSNIEKKEYHQALEDIHNAINLNQEYLDRFKYLSDDINRMIDDLQVKILEQFDNKHKE